MAANGTSYDNGIDVLPGRDDAGSLVTRSGRRPGGRIVPVNDPYAGYQQSAYQPGGGDDEGPQIDIAKVLWRRKWTIIILTILGLAGGYGVFRNTPPVYASSAIMNVRSNTSTAMGETGLGGGGTNFLAQQAAIIDSGIILSRAAARPGISELQSFEGSESVVGSLAEAVSVVVTEPTNFLVIRAEAAQPLDAQKIVDAVRTAYIDYTKDDFTSDAANLLQQLRSEKNRAETDRDELWALRSNLSRELGEIDVRDGRRTSIEAMELGKLSTDLLTAQREASDLRLTLAQAEAATDDPAQLAQLLPTLEEGGAAARRRAEVALLRDQLRDLEYTSGANNSRVLTLRQKINDLESEVDALEEQDLKSRFGILTSRLAIAESRAAELSKLYADRREDLLAVNARAADEEKVRRDIEFVEDWLRQISQRVSEIEVADRSGAAEPEDVQLPGPGVQVAPKAAQLLGMGLVLGMMGGFGLAFLQEWLDPRMRTIDDIERVLGLPVLGLVPKFGDSETPAERARQMIDQPRSEPSEAYRSLRTTLLALLQQRVFDREAEGELDAEQARSILITSPLSGDGKTTLAANLATAFARLDRRTLIIDADCRKPRLHRYLLPESFAGDHEHGGGPVGLTSVLSGKTTLQETIQSTKLVNLDVLPCGPLPQDPSEMLNSEAFADLLHTVSSEYDRVVIDSPPVLPVTDARVLGSMVDATVLVVRAGVTSRKAATVARDGLVRTNADLVGFVANDVKIKRNRFGYENYGYGYGHYGYGYGEPAQQALPAEGVNGHGRGE